jgi:hypothetical protein
MRPQREDKKLEAVGDALLLASARMYLRDQHGSIPYELYTHLIAYMVSNRRLEIMAEGEGVGGENPAASMEMAIASHFYKFGFDSCKLYVWSLFDKYLDIESEVRRRTDPTRADRFTRILHGALRNSIKAQGGQITERNSEQVARQMIRLLMGQGKL